MPRVPIGCITHELSMEMEHLGGDRAYSTHAALYPILYPRGKNARFVRTPIWLETACVIGRGEMIRTSDPLHPMQVRYQAALRPDRSF